MKKVFAIVFLIVCGRATAQLHAPAPFQTGDRVAFMGNSITEAGYYESYIWLYYMLHFPEKRITVFNVGIGGDRAENMYKRFDDDVLSKRPTVVCLTFGMNDSGYFEFLGPNPDSGARARVATSRHFFELLEPKLKALSGARKILISSSPYDETMKNPKNYFPKKSLAMEQITQFQEAAANENHWGFVDFFHPMTAITLREQQKDSAFTLTGDDRIHPGNAGHFVMAYLFLKAQGLGGRVVADISLDARTHQVQKQDNCSITGLTGSPADLHFNYLAASLPYPVDTVPRLWGNPRPQSGAVSLLPFYTEFNREMLRVNGLGDKTYELRMDGKPIGQWTGAQLGEGINLAMQTNTPEYEQAMSVLLLNEERMAVESKIRAYYWLQFDYFRDLNMMYKDDAAAMDSVNTAAAKRWDVASKRDNYRAARYPAVRQGWLKQMNTIIDDIYTINRPVTHSVELRELP
ncbi:SGNH/GDSL hydrolase family protein [Dinghuibacter silviterrae]|uniref:Lysophospholipase L1-like esterase n=1 Tax=Dinghuibacter silviterrae TaxID=1539049 RepID=A0A4R8DFG9_9BACT|nr:SGNH/GDSL hydrolase family protein [Dinghuibacter silviterrae]TDW96331.1 lysophospholipase L1-like esterase [Dinghuibacter silviterrae]